MKDTPLQGTPTLSRFLRMAIVAGVESAVQIHIDRGDDVNARDAQGQTPLMLSAARNKPTICKLLLAAGASIDLLDPEGRTALGIAMAAGASEAAHVIRSAGKQPVTASPPQASSSHPAGSRTDDAPALTPTAFSLAHPAEATTTLFSELPIASQIDAVTASIPEGDRGDDDKFDLTGWEAEEDQSPPEGEAALSALAVEIQSAISEHKPIDASADWDDLEAFLPELAAPLPRTYDSEARERLRLVLLRAIREGSVPQSTVDDLTVGEHREPDFEASSLLHMVINDLGAETDERFEYCAPHESFEVFVAPREEPGEDDAIAEAMAFMDDWAGQRNDPLRIYQREYQREALLTAEAEVALCQDMERGLEKAFDALATWPAGLRAVLEAAKTVTVGAAPLRWLSSGPRIDLKEGQAAVSVEPYGEAELTTGLEPSPTADGAEDDSNAQFDPDFQASSDEFAEFCSNAELLAALLQTSDRIPTWPACRDAIAALRLTRNFLLDLADSGLGESEAGSVFKAAMGEYRRARDKMATANLKLVASLAKKYLFSGEPLGDLLQEGNIGLLKAVDRYDWRKGFRFSTYATWWIRQQVGRFVADKGRTIRLPVHIYEKTRRIAQTSRAFETKHGRSPSIKELAGLVGLPVDKTAALVRTSLEPLPIGGIFDLDRLIAPDAKDQFTARDPLDIVESAQLVDVVNRLLGDLPVKEQCVVRMRFGIGIQDAMTLEEVGVRLGVTRERIRQIEAAALRRFTASSRFDGLLRDARGCSTQSRRKAQG